MRYDRRWAIRTIHSGLTAALLGTALAGCGSKGAAPAPQAEGNQPAATSVTQAEPSGVANATAAAPDDARLHQSFADATLAEPPPDQRPPDLTLTGKSVGKLYLDVVRGWDAIRFVSPDGRRVNYRAVLDTDMGEIEIALRPDLAPNHVRSFIALSRAGYYDGLVFERTVREQVEGQPDARVELIEGGCPLGLGGAGYGSIGYWLKPEFRAEALHEEGAVGATHGEDAGTAACKFYVNLGKAPFMDGNYTVFGKVTRGLDVARKILTLPVRNDPEFPDGDRPVKPVVIRKVSILADDGAVAKLDR